MVRLDYETLKARRLELDLTQKELAEATGVGINTIKQLETGRSSTDLENLTRLCEYLELDVNSIYHPDYHNTKVLCVLNNKGGCGKTSVCSGLGSAMAEMGLRVLLIDGDGQRNLSSSFDMPKDEKRNFGVAVLNEQDLNGFIQPTRYENIDIVVADVSMGTLDMTLFTKVHRENIVRSILHPVVQRGYYDYIIIDTNPNLSLLNFNIVNSCDYALIPVQPASFDVDGLAVVVDFVRGIQPYNPALKIGGIVINRYDARNKLISETSLSQLKESYGDMLFEQIIRVDAKLQNAQWENRPVLDYSSASRISKEYRALTKEVIKRCS